MGGCVSMCKREGGGREGGREREKNNCLNDKRDLVSRDFEMLETRGKFKKLVNRKTGFIKPGNGIY